MRVEASRDGGSLVGLLITPQRIRNAARDLVARGDLVSDWDDSGTLAALLAHVILATLVEKHNIRGTLMVLVEITNEVIPLGRLEDDPTAYLIRVA